MKPHLVSILIPHHSRPALLKKTLQSCLAQTYKNIEIIVIDDGSPKNEVDEVERMLTDKRCRLVRLPERLGPAHARNFGLKASRGEFIQFLDSDDVIHPRKIELQMEKLIQTGAEWVSSDWRIVFKWGALSFPFPVIKTPIDKEKMLLGTISEKGWFPVMSCLFRKSFLEEMGPWRENDFIEDREFRFRMLVRSHSTAHVDRCLFKYNRYPFLSRRNELLYSREAWDGFVASNRQFVAQVENKLRMLDNPKQEFLNELEELRKWLPMEADVFNESWTAKRQTTKMLIKSFLKSFVRNWGKQLGNYLSPTGRFQMTGGDL